MKWFLILLINIIPTKIVSVNLNNPFCFWNFWLILHTLKREIYIFDQPSTFYKSFKILKRISPFEVVLIEFFPDRLFLKTNFQNKKFSLIENMHQGIILRNALIVMFKFQHFIPSALT